MEQLEYNLVDAYERELNDWWFEQSPAVDRFNNVIVPFIEHYSQPVLEKALEKGVGLEIRAHYD